MDSRSLTDSNHCCIPPKLPNFIGNVTKMVKTQRKSQNFNLQNLKLAGPMPSSAGAGSPRASFARSTRKRLASSS